MSSTINVSIELPVSTRHCHENVESDVKPEHTNEQTNKHHTAVHINCYKVNRKVQEEPQAEAATNPRHQEEEKK